MNGRLTAQGAHLPPTTRIEPQSLLEVRGEPDWSDDRTPARVVYRISAEGQVCRLMTQHYALPLAQASVTEGWAGRASSLKSWIETGEPLRMGA